MHERELDDSGMVFDPLERVFSQCFSLSHTRVCWIRWDGRYALVDVRMSVFLFDLFAQSAYLFGSCYLSLHFFFSFYFLCVRILWRPAGIVLATLWDP